jgi:EAL domain-containing protein (putative c-di-GMP-specific phosphodiesterase class I)
VTEMGIEYSQGYYFNEPSVEPLETLWLQKN